MKSAQSGFTLIEVLAALVVLALTLGGIMNAAAFYGRNAVYLQDKTVAGWVANNLMVEQQLSRSWPETGKSDGRIDMARRDWFWERVVEATPDDRIRRVTVRVRLDSAEEDAWLVSLAAFFAQPQPRVPQNAPLREQPRALQGFGV